MPKSYEPPPLLDFVDTAKLDPSQVVFTTARYYAGSGAPGRAPDFDVDDRRNKRRRANEPQVPAARPGLRGALKARKDKPNAGEGA